MKITIREQFAGDDELLHAENAAQKALDLPANVANAVGAFRTLRYLYRSRGRPFDVFRCGGNLTEFGRVFGQPEAEVQGLIWLGESYLDFHMSGDALARFDRALAVAREFTLESWITRIHVALAEAYTQAGHFPQGQFIASTALSRLAGRLDEEKSLRAEDEALDMARAALSRLAGRPDEEKSLRAEDETLDCTVAMAKAVAAAGQYRRASVLLRSVTTEETAQHSNRYKAEIELAICLINLHEYDDAVGLLISGSTRAMEANDSVAAIRAFHEGGLFLADTGKLKEALSCWDTALDIMEARVTSTPVEEFRMSTREAHDVIYEHSMLAAYQLHDHASSWSYGERSQGQLFLKYMRNPDLIRVWFENGDKEKAYRVLSAKVASLAGRLRKETRPRSKRSLKLDYEATKRQKSEFLRNVRAASLAVRAETSEDVSAGVRIRRLLRHAELGMEAVVKPDEVRAALDADSCVLQFFVARDRVLSFCLSNEGFESAVHVVSRVVLREQVERIRALIDELGSSGERSESVKLHEEYVSIVSTLRHGLCEPFAGTLARKKRVCIIPDGPLHYLPFGALRSEGLLLDGELVFAPSASLLLALLARAPRPLRGRAIAFANPEPRSAPLPYAEEEVLKLQGALPDVHVYRRGKATAVRLREEIGSATLVHIACHARFDSENPLLSELQLARDVIRHDPGVVDAFEIQALKLEAGLVVLSCCETGLAELTGAGELFGLVRSFFLAGATTVIASLWRVDDSATSYLMQSMYKALAEDGCRSKAAALQEAQNLLRSSEKYRSPYFWAGFHLFGDWRIGST